MRVASFLLRVEVAPVVDARGAALHGALLRDEEAAQREVDALHASSHASFHFFLLNDDMSTLLIKNKTL